MTKHSLIKHGGRFLAAVWVIAFWLFAAHYGNCQTWKTGASWTGYAAAGVMWGAREAYHADPQIFEKKWNVRPESFFGSEAWVRNYEGNNPEGKHKTNLFNTFRDIHHAAGFASRGFTVSATVVLCTSKRPVRHKILDVLIGLGIQSAASFLTYNSLR